MANVTLTEARVKALQPRKTVRDVRDGKLRGFGVRVLPSGRKRFFIQCQHRGERVWKIVGDTGSMSVKEARVAAGEILAAVRRGEEAPRRSDEPLFEAVAEAVFQSCARVWKPGTLYVNRHYLKNQIIPYFASREIADIDEQDVRNWFASLRATPAAADRSMPILSAIMKEAEKMGLRPEGSNPCRGIRRYRRKGRERFLSEDELRRLSARLSARAKRYPLQVAVIRLLLLTGCRKSEITTLRWSDYREGNLFLPDSKTGPRRVPLNSQARHILDRQPRGESVFVFPSPLDPERHRGSTLPLWYRVRREAGIDDVRLHDLRHTMASHAVMSGVPVPVVSRLLGHSNVRMTLRYAHIADRDIEATAERMGESIGSLLGL